MNFRRFTLLISIVLYTGFCAAQNITDVEAKPYGSYSGGTIDTIDLASGNVMINIPLISFPQRGSLPPLSFSIEANNAPYAQPSTACDSNGQCWLLSTRYDTTAPGAIFQPSALQNTSSAVFLQPQTVTCPTGWQGSTPCYADWGEQYGQYQNIGVYLASSFEGGIVSAKVDETGGATPGYEFSAIDASGTTHLLESDASALGIYRASDGSGYTFWPSGYSSDPYTYDAFNVSNTAQGTVVGMASASNWLSGAAGPSSGVRTGTLVTASGIQYTTSILPPFTIPIGNQADASSSHEEQYVPRALITTESDPAGNIVTRQPWYWSGYYSVSNNEVSEIHDIYSGSPAQYVDSVGRVIPDVISMQSTSQPGQPITWQVPGPNGNPLFYTINYEPIGGIGGWDPQVDTGPPDPYFDNIVKGWAIQSLTLPNNTQWKFWYAGQNGDASPLGPDLVGITTPANGTISFTYTTIPPVSYPFGVNRCNVVCHAVQTRTVTDGQGHSWTTNYSYGVYTDPSQLTNCQPISSPGDPSMFFAFWTTETDSRGNDTVHSFCPIGVTSGIPVANQYHEIQTDYYQGCLTAEQGCNSSSGRHLLKSVATSFQSQVDIVPPSSSGANPGSTNVLPVQTVTTTPLGSQRVSITQTRTYSQLFNGVRVVAGCDPPTSSCLTYGLTNPGNLTQIPISYNVPTTVTVRDPSGNIVKTDTTQYEFQSPLSQAYTNANLISLPLSGVVSGGGSSQTTSYSYDENNGSPQGAFGNLTSESTASSMASGGTPGIGGSSTINTHTIFNGQGMPVTKIDGNGNSTNIVYDASGLFTSSIQHPTTGSVHHIDYYSYDINTGALKWHTDENGSAPDDVNHTVSYGYDAVGRIISIHYPDGGGSTFCYTDAGSNCTVGNFQGSVPFSLYTNTVATPDPSISTVHSYDGWGRQYHSSILSDPLGATLIDTTYDEDGRVLSVTNPYRSTPAANDPPRGTTSYTYDALGRKTIQTQPDGNVQQWCYDGLSTGQSNCTSLAEKDGYFTPASWTDFSDETGRRSQQVFDALGNLGAVVESDPLAQSLSLETDYLYDAFGDLLNAYQQGPNSNSNPTNIVQRYFSYDAPGRVTFACNPEACGVRYIYDSNSNVIQRTDGRGIATTYSYDALSRLLSKTYSNDPTGTPSSCYRYDVPATGIVTNGSGRLTAQWTQPGVCPSSPGTGFLTESLISGYDSMGRVLTEQRCVAGTNCAANGYSMSYGYDLAGKLTSYPSGFGGYAFAQTYDAAGRTSAVIGTKNSVNTTLFSTPSYTPSGAMSSVLLGTGVTVTRTFDSRQRILTENDYGWKYVGNAAGSATLSISGSEQSK